MTETLFLDTLVFDSASESQAKGPRTARTPFNPIEVNPIKANPIMVDTSMTETRVESMPKSERSAVETSVAVRISEAVAERAPRLRRPGAPDDAEAGPVRDQTDAQLMSRVKSGDQAAFRELVDRHRDPLVNYLTRLTRCRDRAEEYAQETFVRLYNVADRYQEQGYLAGYLFRIATNLLRTDERRKKRWRTLSGIFAASQSGSSTLTPQREFLSGEASEVVTAAIAELPLQYRAPLVLREIEGLSYREIAEALQCREGTVKSRISRAKARLKERLAEYWHGEQT